MILVVGATGTLGGRVTRRLLAKGEAVRILARHNSPSAELAEQGRANTAQSLIDSGAKVVYGDLKERTSLNAAVDGVDTVITTASAIKRQGEDTIESVDRQGTLNLIDAAQKAGVRHFIYTSVPNASTEHPSRVNQIKGECQEAIDNSGMTFTFAQPRPFMEIWIGVMVGIPLSMQQPVNLIGQGDHAHNFISEADVAAFLVSMVKNPLAYDQSINLGGPASFTWTEIVKEIGRRMGIELPLQYLPMGSTIAYLPAAVSEFATAFETYEDFLDMSQIAPAYGVKLTTLGEYIDRTFVR